MKTTKRLSIEFQHREVTISVAGSTLHVQDGESDAASTSTVCPICGSPLITIVVRVNEDIPANTDRIHRALKQAGLHLQISPAGQLQVCRPSFAKTKEKL